MSMPVLQAEPRCVADAAPTAAIPIPCETVTVRLVRTATPQERDEECRMGERLGRFVAPVSEDVVVTGKLYDIPHRPIRQGDHPRTLPSMKSGPM